MTSETSISFVEKY